MAAAPAVDLLLLLLLLVALLIIALLLLLPETHTTLECRAKGGLVRELTYRASTSWRHLGAAPS